MISAAAERHRYLRQREAFQRLRELKEGDTIRVVGNIKPRYMAGRTGKVVALTNTKRRGFPMVEVDFGQALRRYGPIVSMPASCLIVVPEQGKLV